MQKRSGVCAYMCVCVCVGSKVNRGYSVYSTKHILLRPCFSSHICRPAPVVVLQLTTLWCSGCLRPGYSVWISALLLIASYANVENQEYSRMLPSSNAQPNPPPPALTLPLSLSLFLPRSHCVLGSLPPPLSYHLFSLPGLGSFYCLKGTLLTAHICPFIILRGLFYSCPGTVADADRCLAMSNRSEKASAGSVPARRAEREAHPCQFCNRKKCGGGKERMDKKKGCEGEQSEIYQKENRWRQQKEFKRWREGERDRDPKGNKERCSKGDISCRLGQGIMVLLHF